MGCEMTKTIETGKSVSSNPNGKTINLYAEICDAWGYFQRVASVKDYIIQKLTESGYNVIYSFVPKPGRKNEFDIYHQDDKGNKKLIFSNNQKHKSEDVVISYQINGTNSQEIISKINA